MPSRGRMTGKLRVHGLEPQRRRWRLQVEWLPSEDIDRAADTALLQIRLLTLVDLHLADEVGRQNEVVEGPGGCLLVENEPVGGCHSMAIIRCMRQIVRRAANADALAFAVGFIDDYTRDPLQGFCDVLVRKLADVLGGNGIYDRIRLPLHGNRIPQGGADTRNDYLFERSVGRGIRRRSVRRLNTSVASKQRHGDRCSHQRRPCDSHRTLHPAVLLVPGAPWRCSHYPALPLRCQYSTTVVKIPSVMHTNLAHRSELLVKQPLMKRLLAPGVLIGMILVV
jgi:hypothetical protein